MLHPIAVYGQARIDVTYNPIRLQTNARRKGLAQGSETSGRKEAGLRSCHCPFLPHFCPHPCISARVASWAGPGLAWVLPFHCPGSPAFLLTHTLAHAS